MTFAAGAIREMGINVDVIRAHRSKYSTAKEAKKITGRHGGMKAFAMEIFKDFPQISLQAAKRGDVVLLKVRNTLIMGVCIGIEAAVLGPEGIDFISIQDHGDTVWAIGHK